MITKSKKSNVGQLDKRVTFQFYSTTSDSRGGTIPSGTPTDVLTTWASITPTSGDEFMSQDSLQGNITHKIKARYRDDLDTKGYSNATYDNNLQANYGGRIFNIQYVFNQGEDNYYVTMLAVEEVGNET